MAPPIIFLGPSLSMERARHIFSFADYRPPARKGDLLRLATEDSDENNTGFVGLVDGVFLQDYPPTPIEVYTLLQKKKGRILLAGAASLGALRAVELERFGMIGIGKIFRLYRSGKLDSDDEVAVTFSEPDYRLQSEAMIDIRYTLHWAAKDRIIKQETKNALARIAKQIYFPSRNYEEILERARASGAAEQSELERLSRYISTHRRSLKEEDSIRLIEFVKKRYLESLRT